MALRADSIERLLDDYPSPAGSLEDFEADRSAHFTSASIHSIARSERSEAESDRSSAPWSPPAWNHQGANWYQRSRSAPVGASYVLRHSKSPSHGGAYEDDIENTLLPFAANIPLPPSPEKDTPVEQKPEMDAAHAGAESNAEVDSPHVNFEDEKDDTPVPEGGNFIRFAMRAEVQHRTQPIEDAIMWLGRKFGYITQSFTHFFTFLFACFIMLTMLRALFSKPTPLPGPDIVKASGLARTFEPLVHFSDQGKDQVIQLQDTSVAVWDLGESVRAVNMSSSRIIVSELDGLADNLRTLAMELTRFCAHVGGDVDAIILVLQWAKTNLESIEQPKDNSVVSALDNVHGLLSRVGLLQTNGELNSAGRLVQAIFGLTPRQKGALKLHHTFNEFLTTLEDTIANELKLATELFKIFESIDKQFQNLHRVVIRETDQQERELGQELSSLWVQMMSSKREAAKSKFEKNKELLLKLRERTVFNKRMLAAHNTQLQTLKSNLEVLRSKLVSPLIRSNGSDIPSLEKQIQSLEETYEYLRDSRRPQRDTLWDGVHAFNERRTQITGYTITGYTEQRALESGR